MITVGQKFTEQNNPHHKRESDAVIYLLTNRINNKIYVGSAINFNKRFYRYRKFRHGGPQPERAIEHAIKKYGFENFEFTILDVMDKTGKTKEEVKNFSITKEQYWMDFYRCYEKKIGYNILRKAYSAIGYKASAETRKRVSAAVLKRSHEISKQRSKPVLQIDRKTLKVLKEYPSVKMAALSIRNKISATIYSACHRKISSAYGFYWIFKSDYEKHGFSPRKKYKTNASYARVKPIYQMSIDGKILKIWESLSQIHKELRYDFGLIIKCCKGLKNVYNGYKWKWIEEGEIINKIRESRKLLCHRYQHGNLPNAS